MKIRKLFSYAWLLLIAALPTLSHAQVTVTVNCTGTTGSFKSGSVNSAGVLADGDFTPANTNSVRGWAVFDLAGAGIPVGSTITGASLIFNKSAMSGSGTFAGNIKALSSDISTLAAASQGATAYTTINAGTSVNTAAWTNSTGSKTLTLNAAGITFLQNNFSNTATMCWSITGSTRTFTITGYGGTSTTQPRLSITYLPPCTGTPVAGTANSSSLSICASSPLTLSLTGATIAAGLTYQWQSSPAGLGTWSNIPGATTASYNYAAGITAATDFRAYISCSNTSLGDTTTNMLSVAIAASGLPENFSSTNFPPCGWEFGTGPDFVVHDPVTSAFGLGTGSAYFDFYALDPGFESSPYADLITLTFPAVTAGTILSFDEAYATYTGNEVDNLLIQASTNGGTSYTTLTTFTGGPTGSLNTGGVTASQFVPTSSQWQNKQVLLPAGVNRIRFRGESGYGNELYIDNVALLPPPSCIFPTALTATNVTAASATLGWTNAGTATQYRVEYGPLGFTPGTGTFVLVNVATTLNITALSANTNYSFYVRSLCSATDSSSQSGPFNFVTPCTAIGVPYTQDFEGVVAPLIPSCHTVEDVNNDAFRWITDDNFSASGTNSMAYNYNFNGITGANDWFYTPGINMTAGTTYVITFKYAAGSSSFPEKLEVKTGASAVATAMTSAALFSNSNITNTTFNTASFYYTPSASGVQYFGWHCFSDPDELTLYIDDISIDLGPTCIPPTNLITSNLTPNSVDLGWTNNNSSSQFGVEYGLSGFTPGTGTYVFATSNIYNISGLTPGTPYSFYVRSLCSSTDSSTLSGPESFTTLIANDIPVGAITLTVGAGCIGTPYTNLPSTHSAGEPYTSCRGAAGFHSVWYKFVAPPSGFVRVTNDYAGATIGNSRIAVFSTPDPNNFAAFTILACDDNNGATVTNKSLLYVNGLTSGATYYVEVDGVNNGTAQGTFCLTVDEVSSTMLSTTAACAAGHAQANKATSYRGWISLVDDAGKLIANVRQTNSATTSPTAYASAVNINSASVRQNNGLYYLDRNYMISATGTNATQSFDVQFYFLNSELTALQGVDATATAGDLNVTRQAGSTCQADFATANGARTILLQTGNSSVGGVTGVQVVTPGFSNFYLHAGIVPLTITMEAISGVNVGTRNRVDWSTATEEKGDVFIVQRSVDGENFKDIGTVKANGRASEYSFWDESPVAGVNHYRLRLSDAAGASSYSSTVHISVAATNSFTVEAYPNPVREAVTIKLYGTPGSKPHVLLTDVTGKLIRSADISGESATIDMNGLVPGFYLLKYSDGTNSQVIKLNKE